VIRLTIVGTLLTGALLGKQRHSPLIQQSHESSTTILHTTSTGNRDSTVSSSSLSLTILDLPELTTWLVGNYSNTATQFYDTTLNEEQGEIWLHRGFERFLSQHPQLHPRDEISPIDNDKHQHVVVMICAYLHLNHYLYRQYQKKGQPKQGVQPPYSVDELIDLLTTRITENIDHNRNTIRAKTTYILAVPTWNPKRGNEIGLSKIQNLFHLTTANSSSSSSSSNSSWSNDIQYISLGYERNIYWQKVISPNHIIPIPYVVSSINHQQMTTIATTMMEPKQQRPNSIFYVGDTRPNAVRWSGCNRTALLKPIIQAFDYVSTNINNSIGNHYSNKSSIDKNVFIRLINSNRYTKKKKSQQLMQVSSQRLTMIEYNTIMSESKFCLIVCGDTPTSRSLASAIIHGCVPLFIGIERWYGYCMYPCHVGWGWNTLHESIAYSNNMQQQHMSHFPFETIFDYSLFPSIDENQFLQNPVRSLETFLNQSIDYNTNTLKSQFLNTMLPYNNDDFQSAFIYGYDNPMTTQLFGKAVQFIWTSIIHHLSSQQ
jgi:Exostosin family